MEVWFSLLQDQQFFLLPQCFCQRVHTFGNKFWQKKGSVLNCDVFKIHHMFSVIIRPLSPKPGRMRVMMTILSIWIGSSVLGLPALIFAKEMVINKWIVTLKLMVDISFTFLDYQMSGHVFSFGQMDFKDLPGWIFCKCMFHKNHS